MKAFVVILALLASPALAGDDKKEQGKPLSYKQKMAIRKAVEKAGLPLGKLLDQSKGGLKWNWEYLQDFVPTIQAASDAVNKLHAKFPSAVADAYGNGTLTNAEDSFKMFGGGNLERGCISHQQKTFEAVKPLLPGSSKIVVKKIRYGLPPMQHNAVIVFPRGTDWKYTGIVYDGWKRQKSRADLMIYLYEDWGPIRPVWGIEIEPRYWKANVQLLDDNE